MNDRALAMLFSGLITAVTIFVTAAVIALGLEALTKPYILGPVASTLSSTGAYLGTLGSKKSSKSLKYIGGTLIAIS